MIVVAKKLSVLQLFISRMPKMCAKCFEVSYPHSDLSIAWCCLPFKQLGPVK